MKYPITIRNEEAKQWEIYLVDEDSYVREEERKICVMYNESGEVTGYKVRDER